MPPKTDAESDATSSANWEVIALTSDGASPCAGDHHAATSTESSCSSEASRIRRQGLRRRRGVGLVVDARAPRHEQQVARHESPPPVVEAFAVVGPIWTRLRGSRRPPLPGPATRSSRRCAHRAAAGRGPLRGRPGLRHPRRPGRGPAGPRALGARRDDVDAGPEGGSVAAPGPPLRVSPRPPSRQPRAHECRFDADGAAGADIPEHAGAWQLQLAEHDGAHLGLRDHRSVAKAPSGSPRRGWRAGCARPPCWRPSR